MKSPTVNELLAELTGREDVGEGGKAGVEAPRVDPRSLGYGPWIQSSQRQVQHSSHQRYAVIMRQLIFSDFGK